MSRKLFKIIASIIFVLIFKSFLFGQVEQFTKGMTVVPKFPAGILEFDKVKPFSLRSQFKASVTKTSEDKILINNSPAWTASFPLITEFEIKEVETSKKKPTRVLLITNEVIPGGDYRTSGSQIEILIPNELNAQSILNSILFKGTKKEFVASDYFGKQEKSLLPVIFSNKLENIPFEKQRKLLQVVNYDILAYGSADFKDKSYLSFKFSENVIYNTIQLNQAERAARKTETALKYARKIFEETGRIENLEGIKIITDISYKDFLKDRFNSGEKDKYEMYIPFEILQKFKDAEITNQDVVDGSIILINDSRVKVDLTSFS